MTISNKRLSLVLDKISILGPEAKVLDVGGGMFPLGAATHVIDFLPYQKPKSWHGNGTFKFSKDTWYVCDINRDKFPFENNFFDFVFSSHTLEDIVFPFNAMDEIMRVGKEGYIETPSLGWEITKNIQGKGICGAQHHKWCVKLDEIDSNCILFIEKSDCIYRSPLYRQSKRAYLKSGESDAMSFYSKDSFSYKHVTNFDTLATYEFFNDFVSERDKIKKLISKNRFTKNLFNSFF